MIATAQPPRVKLPSNNNRPRRTGSLGLGSSSNHSHGSSSFDPLSSLLGTGQHDNAKFEAAITRCIPSEFLLIASQDDHTQAQEDYFAMDNFELGKHVPKYIAKANAGSVVTSALLQLLYDNPQRACASTCSGEPLNLFQLSRELKKRVKTATKLEARPTISSSRPIGPPRLRENYAPFYIVPPNYTSGVRRALLIGVVTGQGPDLKGPPNDVANIQAYLERYCGFQRHNITVLQDFWDGAGATKPMKRNILLGFQKLARESQPGDVCFVQFTGHGGRMGNQLYICPSDYAKAGQVSDEMIMRELIKAMPAQTYTTMLVDCCYSGTVGDLPYVLHHNKTKQTIDAFYDANTRKEMLRKEKENDAEYLAYKQARAERRLVGRLADVAAAVVNTAAAAGKSVGNAAVYTGKTAANAAVYTGKATATAVTATGKTAAKTAAYTGKTAAKTAAYTGKTAAAAAKTTGKTAATAAKTTGKTAVAAANFTGKTAANAGKVSKNAAKAVGKTGISAVSTVGKTGASAVSSVGNGLKRSGTSVASTAANAVRNSTNTIRRAKSCEPAFEVGKKHSSLQFTETDAAAAEERSSLSKSAHARILPGRFNTTGKMPSTKPPEPTYLTRSPTRDDVGNVRGALAAVGRRRSFYKKESAMEKALCQATLQNMDDDTMPRPSYHTLNRRGSNDSATSATSSSLSSKSSLHSMMNNRRGSNESSTSSTRTSRSARISGLSSSSAMDGLEDSSEHKRSSLSSALRRVATSPVSMANGAASRLSRSKSPAKRAAAKEEEEEARQAAVERSKREAMEARGLTSASFHNDNAAEDVAPQEAEYSKPKRSSRSKRIQLVSNSFSNLAKTAGTPFRRSKTTSPVRSSSKSSSEKEDDRKAVRRGTVLNIKLAMEAEEAARNEALERSRREAAEAREEQRRQSGQAPRRNTVINMKLAMEAEEEARREAMERSRREAAEERERAREARLSQGGRARPRKSVLDMAMAFEAKDFANDDDDDVDSVADEEEAVDQTEPESTTNTPSQGRRSNSPVRPRQSVMNMAFKFEAMAFDADDEEEEEVPEPCPEEVPLKEAEVPLKEDMAMTRSSSRPNLPRKSVVNFALPDDCETGEDEEEVEVVEPASSDAFRAQRRSTAVNLALALDDEEAARQEALERSRREAAEARAAARRARMNIAPVESNNSQHQGQRSPVVVRPRKSVMNLTMAFESMAMDVEEKEMMNTKTCFTASVDQLSTYTAETQEETSTNDEDDDDDEEEVVVDLQEEEDTKSFPAKRRNTAINLALAAEAEETARNEALERSRREAAEAREAARKARLAREGGTTASKPVERPSRRRNTAINLALAIEAEEAARKEAMERSRREAAEARAAARRARQQRGY